jgi:hypothetical protein
MLALHSFFQFSGSIEECVGKLVKRVKPDRILGLLVEFLDAFTFGIQLQYACKICGEPEQVIPASGWRKQVSEHPNLIPQRRC